MANREEPYDPYIPSGNSAAAGANAAGGNARTAAIQAEIDNTIGEMSKNLKKMEQRGGQLDALENKADNLVHSTREFRRGANRVRKDMWWKDMKMRMCLIVGIILLLVVIIVPIVVVKH